MLIHLSIFDIKFTFKTIYIHTNSCIYLCVCVYKEKREREREREILNKNLNFSRVKLKARFQGKERDYTNHGRVKTDLKKGER